MATSGYKQKLQPFMNIYQRLYLVNLRIQHTLSDFTFKRAINHL
jgi:hypothetical protein